MLARTLLLTLSAVLTNNVVLADYSSQEAGLFKRALIQERQSQAFTPSTDSGSGTTCVAAFGPGWEPCGPVQCYNPGDGQGLPVDTCAAQNGVSLSAGFKTNAVSIVTSTSTVSTRTNPVTTSTTVVSKAYTTTVVNPVYYGNFTGSPTVTPAIFTGAANPNNVAGGVAAVLLGLIGAVGNAL